ncbi:hypothetical protein D3C79_941710 [compost metagenome]
MYTVLFDDIPGNRGILAMYMEYFVSPFPQLGNRINQRNHLGTVPIPAPDYLQGQH